MHPPLVPPAHVIWIGRIAGRSMCRNTSGPSVLGHPFACSRLDQKLTLNVCVQRVSAARHHASETEVRPSAMDDNSSVAVHLLAVMLLELPTCLYHDVQG